MKFSKIASVIAISICLSSHLVASTFLEDIRVEFLTAIETGADIGSPGFDLTLIDYVLALSNDEQSTIKNGINGENDIKFITKYLDKSYRLVTQHFEANIKKPLEDIINSDNIDPNRLEEVNDRIYSRTLIFNLDGKLINGRTIKLTQEDIKNYREELKNILDNFMIDKRKRLLSNVEYFKSLVKDKIEELKRNGASEDEIKEAQEWLKDAEKNKNIISKEIKNDNIKDIRDLASKKSTDTLLKEVLDSLYDATISNEALADVVIALTPDQVIHLSKDITSSIQAVAKSLGQSPQNTSIKFNTDLATQTRLAKLNNPFNDNLALAYAIKNLNSVGSFASGDNSALSSVIKDYTDRFNYDNNLWGTILGGKAKFKGGADASIYGFTLGYDKAFDNTIIGGYATYAKSKTNSDKLDNKADNYRLGIYARHYIENNEIDAKISVGKIKNKFERNINSPIGTLAQNGKYDSIDTSLEVDYGYVFNLQDSSDKFIKPIIGLSYNVLNNKSFQENGVLPLAFDKTTSKLLNLKVGAEFRKYIENGNYFYVASGVEKEIYKRSNDVVAKFVGSQKDIIFKADNKKSAYFTLQSGAEFNLTSNLSTNVNLGIKAKSKERFYNGTLGLKYKF